MSRYRKKIRTGDDGLSDLYDIAEAYAVKSNPQFHAFKKTIMAGQRGDKGVLQDIDEAIQALQRWKEMVRSQAGAAHIQTSHVADALRECPRCLGRFPADQPCPTCARHEKKPWICRACLTEFAGDVCPKCFSQFPVGAPTLGET